MQIAAEAHKSHYGSHETSHQRLESEQHSDGQYAMHDSQTAQVKDGGSIDRIENRRSGRKPKRRDTELLAGIQHLGLIACPASKVSGFAASGLHRLNHLQPSQRDTREFAFFLQVEPVLIGMGARHQEENQQVRGCDQDPRRGEQNVVADHEKSVEADHQQVDEMRGDSTCQQRRHPVVAANALAHVSGEPLREELQRQPQHMPYKTAG